jgi:hypothetical protein
LCDTADAAGVQPCRITAFRAVRDPSGDRRLERRQKSEPSRRGFLGIAKAGNRSRVTGRPDGVGEHEDRVVVAIGRHLHDIEKISDSSPFVQSPWRDRL